MADSSADEAVDAGGGQTSDPGAYATELKRKLDLYCAAVAKTMEAKTQESSLDYSVSEASDTSQLIFQASLDANIGTSKEQSNGDGDLEENTDPTDSTSFKRLRRLLSNRESARRSRKRKQSQLNNLHSQISLLTAENASLLKRLADVTQKYKEATIDIQTMQRKVNIAEEAVRRVTGASMLVSPTTSDMLGSGVSFNSYPSDAASAAVPVEESMQRSPGAVASATCPDRA